MDVLLLLLLLLLLLNISFIGYLAIFNIHASIVFLFLNTEIEANLDDLAEHRKAETLTIKGIH